MIWYFSRGSGQVHSSYLPGSTCPRRPGINLPGAVYWDVSTADDFYEQLSEHICHWEFLSQDNQNLAALLYPVLTKQKTIDSQTPFPNVCTVGKFCKKFFVKLKFN